jgi:transcriptional antiterminator
MIEVKGTGKYRPGDVLIYDSNERQTIIKLYIERVVHKFVNFQYFTTELYVSRGVITKDKRNA